MASDLDPSEASVALEASMASALMASMTSDVLKSSKASKALWDLNPSKASKALWDSAALEASESLEASKASKASDLDPSEASALKASMASKALEASEASKALESSNALKASALEALIQMPGENVDKLSDEYVLHMSDDALKKYKFGALCALQKEEGYLFSLYLSRVTVLFWLRLYFERYKKYSKEDKIDFKALKISEFSADTVKTAYRKAIKKYRTYQKAVGLGGACVASVNEDPRPMPDDSDSVCMAGSSADSLIPISPPIIVSVNFVMNLSSGLRGFSSPFNPAVFLSVFDQSQQYTHSIQHCSTAKEVFANIMNRMPKRSDNIHLCKPDNRVVSQVRVCHNRTGCRDCAGVANIGTVMRHGFDGIITPDALDRLIVFVKDYEPYSLFGFVLLMFQMYKRIPPEINDSFGNPIWRSLHVMICNILNIRRDVPILNLFVEKLNLSRFEASTSDFIDNLCYLLRITMDDHSEMTRRQMEEYDSKKGERLEKNNARKARAFARKVAFEAATGRTLKDPCSDDDCC